MSDDVTPDSPFDPETSSRIGPYKILRALGEGGMGIVYEAEQTEPVYRRVALKIIKLGMDTKQVVARFEAERQALAVMDHPNIARVFDAGASETGRPYFAMELVKGTPLNEYCDTHKLSTEERIRLFTRVCQAVQHAHQKGVIHRDLKPSNVLVTIQDERAVPKVIDFGIAKAVGHELTEKTLVTQLGQLMGAPRYMSPEQAEMTGLDVDTRTDIYSLGIMLYELLVGAAPFEFGDIGFAALKELIRELDPPTPSSRLTTLPGETQDAVAVYRHTDPVTLKRQLKGDLDWVVMKCLEKDRTRRYETANGLAVELERYLRDEPVTARPPSNGYRLRKLVRRHRVGAAFVATVALLLVAFAVAMAVQTARIARERDRATLEQAKAEAAFEVLLMGDPISQIEGPGPDATLVETMDWAVSVLGERFSDQPEVDAGIRTSIGRVYLRLGRYEDAEPLLQQSLSTQRKVVGEDHLDYGVTLGYLADLAEARGELDSAQVLYERAVATYREHLDPLARELGGILARQSNVLIARGEYDAARETLTETLDIYRSRGEDTPHEADVTSRLGYLYRALGDLDRAEQYSRQALGLRQRFLREDHPLLGESLNNLAAILDDRGEREEAAAYYRRALEILEAAFGPNSDRVGAVLGNLGLLLTDIGDPEAEMVLRRGLALDVEALGEESPWVAIARNNLARHLCLNEQSTEGAREAEMAVLALEAALQPGQFEIGVVRSVYGMCLGVEGRFEEGERQLLEALQVVVDAMGSDHPRVPVIRSRLADLYDAWGRPDRAAEYR
jgi:serine/threonine protein kinase/Tfp pilus assembly protein PilF